MKLTYQIGIDKYARIQTETHDMSVWLPKGVPNKQALLAAAHEIRAECARKLARAALIEQAAEIAGEF